MTSSQIGMGYRPIAFYAAIPLCATEVESGFGFRGLQRDHSDEPGAHVHRLVDGGAVDGPIGLRVLLVKTCPDRSSRLKLTDRHCLRSVVPRFHFLPDTTIPIRAQDARSPDG